MCRLRRSWSHSNHSPPLTSRDFVFCQLAIPNWRIGRKYVHKEYPKNTRDEAAGRPVRTMSKLFWLCSCLSHLLSLLKLKSLHFVTPVGRYRVSRFNRCSSLPTVIRWTWIPSWLNSAWSISEATTWTSCPREITSWPRCTGSLVHTVFLPLHILCSKCYT